MEIEENIKNDSTIVNVSSSTAESEVKDETEKKILFKKPQIGLIIGPRKGKVIGKLRNLEPVTDVKSHDPAADALGLLHPGPRSTSTADVVEKPKNMLSDSLILGQPVGLELHTGESSIKDVAEKVESKLVLPTDSKSSKVKSGLSPAQQIAENIPIPYKEPKWGGCPDTKYNFEVLKSGKILEHIDLSNKSFYVFGRLANSDVNLAHPTISRHHAVVQYRKEGSLENTPGFYLYDLGSTHGTFLNKNRIKPNMYVRLHVGHVLKFGCSTRLFVLQGPEEDEEEESELTLTQIKEKRKVEILRRIQSGETVTQEESDGIDWGMGEDADEETDLSINPFATTNNEELYLDDPKKTLRGWFEREGIELEYDVQERGVAQFLCRVELPVESARGGTVMAEAVVQGKKKEAVVQCALEACRILDRYGLLRQATHESKKRKARDWASEDFYDSDEDTFLDRTGAVEQKRLARMRAAGRREVLTYQNLVEQHDQVMSELRETEKRWREATARDDRVTSDERDNEDELDAFMKNLSSGGRDKLLISKLKSSLVSLKAEEARLRKLVNIARPANLPELKQETFESVPSTAQTTASKMTAILGKARRQIKSKHGITSKHKTLVEGRKPDRELEEEEEEEEEEDDDEEDEVKQVPEPRGIQKKDVTGNDRVKNVEEDEEIQRVEMKQDSLSHLRLKIEEKNTVKTNKEEDDGDEESPAKELSEKEVERRKRRNQKRMLHRNAKLKKESNAEWNEVAASDPSLYSTWVPPTDQSGDGRTSLNEKLGY